MIERFSDNICKAVKLQNYERRIWMENDSQEKIERMILEEGEEMRMAVQEAMIGKDPIHLISEVGDVLYLSIRLTDFDKPVGEDALQVIDEALAICRDTGVTPDECVEIKLMRNDLKYPHYFSNNGWDYAKSIGISKKQWNLLGGDEHFYQAFENMDWD